MCLCVYIYTHNIYTDICTDMYIVESLLILVYRHKERYREREIERERESKVRIEGICYLLSETCKALLEGAP